MQSGPGTVFSEEQRAAHRYLSQSGVDFLDYVESHPEYLERSTFAGIDELEEWVGSPVQPWPTFVRAGRVRELGERNVELCRLAKRVPSVVFRGDAEELGRFYGLEPEHARIVVAALDNPRWVGGALARSDFIDTGEVFQCVELNVAGNMGGWQTSHWGPDFLRDPAIGRFVAEAGLEPRCPSVLRKLMSHLLGQALRAFRSAEIHVAFLVLPLPDPLIDRLIEAAREEYGKLLASLGTLRGSLVRCVPGELHERNGKLYAGDTRVHAVVDAVSGSAGLDAHRCWLRGSVLLFNGPLAPVWSDKRNLALLSELAETGLWTGDEKQVIRATVPWTRRVSERAVHPRAAEPRAAEPVTPELLRAERRHLVLKPGSGYGGHDVYMGPITDDETWSEVVDRAFEDGTWIAQERLESWTCIHQHGDSGCVPFDLVWSFFVFGETFGGSFLRMSPTSWGKPVNSASGGFCGWLFEVDEEEGHEEEGP